MSALIGGLVATGFVSVAVADQADQSVHRSDGMSGTLTENPWIGDGFKGWVSEPVDLWAVRDMVAMPQAPEPAPASAACEWYGWLEVTQIDQFYDGGNLPAMGHGLSVQRMRFSSAPGPIEDPTAHRPGKCAANAAVAWSVFHRSDNPTGNDRCPSTDRPEFVEAQGSGDGVVSGWLDVPSGIDDQGRRFVDIRSKGSTSVTGSRHVHQRNLDCQGRQSTTDSTTGESRTLGSRGLALYNLDEADPTSCYRQLPPSWPNVDTLIGGCVDFYADSDNGLLGSWEVYEWHLQRNPRYQRQVTPAPTQVRAEDGAVSGAGVRAARVTWYPPQPLTPATVPLYYKVTAHPGGLVRTTDPTKPCCQILFRGLQNSRTYRFTVVATNIAGDSPSSELSNAVSTPGVPGQPHLRGPWTKRDGDTRRVTFRWQGVPNNGRSILYYKVLWDRGPDEKLGRGARMFRTWTAKPGLHTFQVRAVNAAGPGPISKPIKAHVYPIR